MKKKGGGKIIRTKNENQHTSIDRTTIILISVRHSLVVIVTVGHPGSLAGSLHTYKPGGLEFKLSLQYVRFFLHSERKAPYCVK